MTGARSFGVRGRARVAALKLRSGSGGRRRIKRRASANFAKCGIIAGANVARGTIRALPERVSLWHLTCHSTAPAHRTCTTHSTALHRPRHKTIDHIAQSKEQTRANMTAWQYPVSQPLAKCAQSTLEKMRQWYAMRRLGLYTGLTCQIGVNTSFLLLLPLQTSPHEASCESPRLQQGPHKYDKYVTHFCNSN